MIPVDAERPSIPFTPATRRGCLPILLGLTIIWAVIIVLVVGAIR